MICRFLQFLKRYGIIEHKSEKNSGCLKPVKGIGMEPLGGSCMVQFQKDAALGGIPEYIWFYPRILFFWCALFGMALAVSDDN